MWFDSVFISDWGLFQRFASVNSISMDPTLTSSIPTRRRCSNSAGTQSLWRNLTLGTSWHILAHLGTQLISAVSDPWHLQGFLAAFFPRISLVKCLCLQTWIWQDLRQSVPDIICLGLPTVPREISRYISLLHHQAPFSHWEQGSSVCQQPAYGKVGCKISTLKGFTDSQYSKRK